jgi:hypothetical protein
VRASLAEQALPLGAGVVAGATFGSVVGGSPWKELAAGVVFGAFAALCLAGALARADRWLR